MSQNSFRHDGWFWGLAILNLVFATAFFIEQDGRRRAEDELQRQSVELLSAEKQRDDARGAAHNCMEAARKERWLQRELDELRRLGPSRPR